MKKYLIVLVGILLLINSNLFSIKLEVVDDKFDECKIYKGDEDTKLNFYIYIPNDTSKKPYIKLIANVLLLYTEFINYSKAIIITDKNKKYEIDFNTAEFSEDVIKRPRRSNGNGGWIGGGTYTYEKATIILNDEQIKDLTELFLDAKEADVRFIGVKSNIDKEIDRAETKIIKAIFEKWEEINSK